MSALELSVTLYPCRIGAEYGNQTRVTEGACEAIRRRALASEALLVKRDNVKARTRTLRKLADVTEAEVDMVAIGACTRCPGCVALAQEVAA